MARTRVTGEHYCYGVSTDITDTVTVHLRLRAIMSDRKYFLDTEDRQPKFPWYGDKYFGDKLARADTGPWRKQRRREKREAEMLRKKAKEKRLRRGFRVVAGQLMTGNKLTFSILAQLKGKLLIKCELPDDLQTESNNILGWVLPTKTKKKIAPAEEENNKDAVHEEDNKDKEDDRDDEPPVVGDHGNPYAVFLDNVKDSTTEEEGAGLMGGLKSWLGFAGSMTGTGSTVLSEPMAGKPWLKGGDKNGGGEDTMTKKAEEHMGKIAGDFCNWLRDLPGEDKTINNLGETQLRALFDTAQSANPGTTKLAEGLRSWAKFGSTVTGAEQTKKGIVEQNKPMLSNQKFVEKLLGVKGGLKPKHLEKKPAKCESQRDRRLYYGAWYVEPDSWHQRHGRQIETCGGTKVEDKTKTRLKAALPGKVDMMGFQQPVSQLQATKAFAQYLNEQKNYKKPDFIKHIIKYNEKEK